MRWLVDQVLAIFNYVPELILDKGDSRFDFLRWWYAFVLLVIVGVIVRMAIKGFRQNRPPSNSN